MRRLRVRFRGYSVNGDAGAFSVSGQTAALTLGLPSIDGSLTIGASNLDATTWSSYSAALTATERAAIVVAALTAPVTVEIRDGLGNLRASGTMVAPWAISSSGTITIGEVNGSYVTVASGGVPDASWYCQWRGANGRYLRGTFGVAGSGRDFVWSSALFATGARCNLGTVSAAATSAADRLQPSDISYVGYYRIDVSIYVKGFTVRRYGSEVRFIAIEAGNQPLREWTTSGVSLSGGTCSVTQSWTFSNVSQYGTDENYHYLYWDPDLQMLWTLQGQSYPESGIPRPTNIRLFSLTSGAGSVGTPYKISLTGVPDRKVFTGVAKVPAAIRAQYGFDEYSVGFGGYASILTGAGGVAMNLAMYTIPNPTSYFASSPSPGSTTPTTSGAIVPHQTFCAPTSDERGVKSYFGYQFTQTGTLSLLSYSSVGYPGGSEPTGTFTALPGNFAFGPLDYYDGAGSLSPYTNGNAPGPINWPLPSGYSWPSTFYYGPRTTSGMYLAAGQVKDWSWGDSYSGGFWVDSGSKRAFVAVGSFNAGVSCYINSAGYSDACFAEVHFFDPADIAAVKGGTLSYTALQPYAVKPLAETYSVTQNNPGYNTWHRGAYDPGPYADGKGRLYVWSNRFGIAARNADNATHVYVYSVTL